MYSDLGRRVAHDDRSILRQPYFIVLVETELDQDSSEIVARCQGRLQIQRELELWPANPDQPAERSKQRWGPCKKVFLSSDQTRVVTSIVSEPILISFTEDGRPPRDRFDTVPAVEITVPFFVCSM